MYMYVDKLYVENLFVGFVSFSVCIMRDHCVYHHPFFQLLLASSNRLPLPMPIPAAASLQFRSATTSRCPQLTIEAYCPSPFWVHIGSKVYSPALEESARLPSRHRCRLRPHCGSDPYLINGCESRQFYVPFPTYCGNVYLFLHHLCAGAIRQEPEGVKVSVMSVSYFTCFKLVDRQILVSMPVPPITASTAAKAWGPWMLFIFSFFLFLFHLVLTGISFKEATSLSKFWNHFPVPCKRLRQQPSFIGPGLVFAVIFSRYSRCRNQTNSSPEYISVFLFSYRNPWIPASYVLRLPVP